MVPTKNFILTVCIKVQEEHAPIHVTPSPEPPQSPENNHFNAFINYAGNIIGRSQKINRASYSITPKQKTNKKKWKLLITDHVLDTSYDVFLNDSQIKGIEEDLDEIDYEQIGKKDKDTDRDTDTDAERETDI